MKEVILRLRTVSKIPRTARPGFSSAGDYDQDRPREHRHGHARWRPGRTAIDPNSDDTLTYDLDNDMDAIKRRVVADDGDRYSGDPVPGGRRRSATSPLTRPPVRSCVKKSLDYDNNMDGYTFHVRAIDPSGRDRTRSHGNRHRQPTPTTRRISWNSVAILMEVLSELLLPDPLLPSSVLMSRTPLTRTTTTARPGHAAAWQGQWSPVSMNVFTAMPMTMLAVRSSGASRRARTCRRLRAHLELARSDLLASAGPGEPIALKFVNDA